MDAMMHPTWWDDRGHLRSIAILLLLAALAWATLIVVRQTSAMMDAMPGRAAFDGVALFAGMWVLMMAAMMLPASMPLVLLLLRVRRVRDTAGQSAIAAGAFIASYLAIWTLAGILADLAYLSVRAVGGRLPTDASTVQLIGGGILVVAGLYQNSPLKRVYLSHCQAPYHCILYGRHEERESAPRIGALYGIDCLGCCWAIMAVLFVVGLMNLAWMAALSVVILVERLLPRGVAIGRLTGVVFIAMGVFMAAQPQSFPASGFQPAATMAMAGMSPAMPASDTQHYRASADPYVITLTVQTHGRFTVMVADRAMGMAVAGARVSLRFNGMGGPSGPVPLPAVNGPKGRIAGLYATTVGLMPGAFVVGIDVNGGAATVHIHIR